MQQKWRTNIKASHFTGLSVVCLKAYPQLQPQQQMNQQSPPPPPILDICVGNPSVTDGFS